MYLLIDGQALQTPGSRHRGVGRYAGSLITALAAARPGWWIEVVQAGHLEPLDAPRVGGAHVRTFRPPLPAKSAYLDANERYYADWLLAQGADTLLVTNFFEAQGILPLFTGPRPPLFGILYDLIPLLFKEHYLSHPEPRGQYARRLRQLLDTDALFAISESSARDLRRLFDMPGPRVTTIGGALDHDRLPLAEADLAVYQPLLREKFGLERDFLLYVGGFDPRKNLPGAMQAYAALPASTRRALDLVIACHLDSGPRAQLEGLARDLGIADTLRLTGFVTDDELRALYQICRLFFFPSLYEGLGLPVLEALRCGAPVLASDRASIPEFAGPVARLFEPEPPAAAALDILHALAEPRDQDRARRQAFAATFTWESCADRAIPALEAPCAEPAPPRRRLAWIAPPAADNDAIREFLTQLARAYEIDLVINPGERPDRTLWKHCGLVVAADLPRRHAACPYDLFVHDLSRGSVQTHALDLLRRFRGLVVLPEDDDQPGPLTNSDLFTLAAGVIASSAAADSAPDAVTRYTAAIEAAIAKRETGDLLWAERAAEALAACSDPILAESLIAPWSALRERARRAVHHPTDLPSSAQREVA